MKAELRCRYLDSDFVEVIWKNAGSEPEAGPPYLWSLLTRADSDAIAQISVNTLLVIDDEAFGGLDVELPLDGQHDLLRLLSAFAMIRAERPASNH
jgi:hypothetical protein